MSGDEEPGLVVTTTGLRRSERDQVRAVVETAGGRYSPNLSRRCTHLVVTSNVDAAQSDKLRAARAQQQKWGIRILTAADFLQEAASQQQQQQRRQQQHKKQPEEPLPTTAAQAKQQEQNDRSSLCRGDVDLPEQAPWRVHFSQLPLDGLYAQTGQQDSLPQGLEGGRQGLLPLLEEQWVEGDGWLAPASGGGRGGSEAAEAALHLLPWQLQRSQAVSHVGNAQVQQSEQQLQQQAQQHEGVQLQRHTVSQQSASVCESAASPDPALSLGDWHRRQDSQQQTPTLSSTPSSRARGAQGAPLHTPAPEPASSKDAHGQVATAAVMWHIAESKAAAAPHGVVHQHGMLTAPATRGAPTISAISPAPGSLFASPSRPPTIRRHTTDAKVPAAGTTNAAAALAAAAAAAAAVGGSGTIDSLLQQLAALKAGGGLSGVGSGGLGRSASPGTSYRHTVDNAVLSSTLWQGAKAATPNDSSKQLQQNCIVSSSGAGGVGAGGGDGSCGASGGGGDGVAQVPVDQLVAQLTGLARGWEAATTTAAAAMAGVGQPAEGAMGADVHMGRSNEPPSSRVRLEDMPWQPPPPLSHQQQQRQGQAASRLALGRDGPLMEEDPLAALMAQLQQQTAAPQALGMAAGAAEHVGATSLTSTSQHPAGAAAGQTRDGGSSKEGGRSDGGSRSGAESIYSRATQLQEAQGDELVVVQEDEAGGIEEIIAALKRATGESRRQTEEVVGRTARSSSGREVVLGSGKSSDAGSSGWGSHVGGSSHGSGSGMGISSIDELIMALRKATKESRRASAELSSAPSSASAQWDRASAGREGEEPQLVMRGSSSFGDHAQLQSDVQGLLAAIQRVTGDSFPGDDDSGDRAEDEGVMGGEVPAAKQAADWGSGLWHEAVSAVCVAAPGSGAPAAGERFGSPLDGRPYAAAGTAGKSIPATAAQAGGTGAADNSVLRSPAWDCSTPWAAEQAQHEQYHQQQQQQQAKQESQQQQDDVDGGSSDLDRLLAALRANVAPGFGQHLSPHAAQTPSVRAVLAAGAAAGADPVQMLAGVGLRQQPATPDFGAAHAGSAVSEAAVPLPFLGAQDGTMTSNTTLDGGLDRLATALAALKATEGDAYNGTAQSMLQGAQHERQPQPVPPAPLSEQQQAPTLPQQPPQQLWQGELCKDGQEQLLLQLERNSLQQQQAQQRRQQAEQEQVMVQQVQPVDRVLGAPAAAQAVANLTSPLPTPSKVVDALSPCGTQCSTTSGAQPAPAAPAALVPAAPMEGVTALLDPTLPAVQRMQLTKALMEAGGRVASGSHLSCGVSLVVCEPHRAAHYMHLLVDLMSPSALLRACLGPVAPAGGGSSGASKAQPQTVTMSADICRAVTSGLRGSGGKATGGAGSGPWEGGASSAASARSSVSGKSSGMDSDANGHSDHVLLGTPTSKPGQQQQQGSNTGLAAAIGLLQVDSRALVSVGKSAFSGGMVMGAASGGRPSGLMRMMPPELLGDLRCQWSVVEDPGACSGVTSEQLEEVVLQGAPSITLLLPQDKSLVLGHVVSRIAVPEQGLTCGMLLRHLHAFYSEENPVDAAGVALLREVQGGAAQDADFEAGAVVPRSAFLGYRLALDGVVRATRDPSSCVYEVCLTM